MSKPIAAYTDIVQCDPGEGVRMLEDAGFEVRVIDSADPTVIAEHARGASALLIGYSGVDRALLDALPDLRIVATQSVGTDMVDVAEAERRGIVVSTVPDAAVEEVATHAFAMVMALLRGLPFLDREVRTGDWDGTTMTLRRPSETTIGVVGLGRIGRKLASLMAPVCKDVVGYDPMIGPDNWPSEVRRVEFDTVLGASDVISLHLPLSQHTHHLIGSAELTAMREGASIVNVSRGGLVAQDALLEHLDSGHLASAALDVLAQEPPPRDDPIRTHPRVLVSPHVAYMSEGSKRDYVVRQARNVIDWHRTAAP